MKIIKTVEPYLFLLHFVNIPWLKLKRRSIFTKYIVQTEFWLLNTNHHDAYSPSHQFLFTYLCRLSKCTLFVLCVILKVTIRKNTVFHQFCVFNNAVYAPIILTVKFPKIEIFLESNVISHPKLPIDNCPVREIKPLSERDISTLSV